MALTVPGYLIASGVQDAPPMFDRNLQRAEEPIDDRLYQRLIGLSQRAMLAFAIGSAEWLVYRLQPTSRDQAPWDFLEAAWAMSVHIKYSNYGKAIGWAEYTAEADEENGSGLFDDPSHRALILLESAIQELAWHGAANPSDYSQYVARTTCLIHNLAKHTIADTRPFDAWTDATLERLTATYPASQVDALGDIVPREALDCARALDTSDSEALVNGFLSRIDRSNRFLSEPEAMLEPIEDDEPFVGTPYVFDITADRARRARAPRR